MSIFEFDEEQYKQALVEETMQLAQERIRKAEEQVKKSADKIRKIEEQKRQAEEQVKQFEDKANQAEKQVKQFVEKEKQSKEKICRALLKKDIPLDVIVETIGFPLEEVQRLQAENSIYMNKERK